MIKAIDLMVQHHISYLDITATDLVKLADHIVAELAAHQGIRMDLLPARYRISSDQGIQFAYFEVRGSYFANRPAISFEKSGFVSIAPWADDQTIKPFMIAFEKWVTWIVTRIGSGHVGRVAGIRNREFESGVFSMVNANG